MLPDPVWPVVVLALVCAVDAAMSAKPMRFIAECWTDVRFPRRWWWILAPIKVAATIGLLAGIAIPWLGLVTSACLVVYFIVAIALHVRARDFGRNLFLNATGMLMLCSAVLVWCFLV